MNADERSQPLKELFLALRRAAENATAVPTQHHHTRLAIYSL